MLEICICDDYFICVIAGATLYLTSSMAAGSSEPRLFGGNEKAWYNEMGLTGLP